MKLFQFLKADRDITVLFTDIQMPGSMDGLKLAAAVKGRWPPIRIVATSGLVDVRPEDLPQGGLPKPYNPPQLTATLRQDGSGQCASTMTNRRALHSRGSGPGSGTWQSA
jgi:CheY-like chemotaxis protein